MHRKMFHNKQIELKVLIICLKIIYWFNIFPIQCHINDAKQNDNFYHNNKIISLDMIHRTMPMRIYECLYNNLAVLRCAKLLLLNQLNDNQQYKNHDNLTNDIFQQFFNITKPMNSLINGNYQKMSDTELNKCLKERLKQYFKNRKIQLQLLPNLLINIKNDPDDKFRVSLKQRSSYYHKRESHARADNLLDYLNEATENLFFEINDDDDTQKEKINHVNKSVDKQIGSVKSKSKKKIGKGNMSILQMAVPIMVMPAILMSTFLPFVLPVLKMATLTTVLMNNAAFISALIYAARTHMNINNHEQQHINYDHYDHSMHH